MASTPKGDIPGARDHVHGIANASVASNGANGTIAPIGPLAHNIRVRNFWWTPTGADQAAHTASYRRLSLVNGGAAGTGTAIVASLNLTASHASLGAVAGVVDTTQSVASGSVLYLKQITVGGASAGVTELEAGSFALSYEII